MLSLAAGEVVLQIPLHQVFGDRNRIRSDQDTEKGKANDRTHSLRSPMKSTRRALVAGCTRPSGDSSSAAASPAGRTIGRSRSASAGRSHHAGRTTSGRSRSRSPCADTARKQTHRYYRKPSGCNGTLCVCRRIDYS